MNVINFQIGDFSDAIVLDDGVTMSDADIEAMKQARYQAWLIACQPVEDGTTS